MDLSNNKHGIYQAIAAIMSDVSAIEKTRKNRDQGFTYRSIDDVYNSLHDLLAKHQVFTVPEILSVESNERTSTSGRTMTYEKYKIKYTFYAVDGSSISATVIGIGMDVGDKAGNKAMSIAHKYALIQVFCIPTSDPKDPDYESHELVTPEPTQLQSRKYVDSKVPTTYNTDSEITTYEIIGKVVSTEVKKAPPDSGKTWILTTFKLDNNRSIGTFDTKLAEEISVAAKDPASSFVFTCKKSSKGNDNILSFSLEALPF
jgi:hypothetical protein